MKNKTALYLIVMAVPCLVADFGMAQENAYPSRDSLQQKPSSSSPVRKRVSAIPRENRDVAAEVNIVIYKAELKEVSFSGSKYHVVTEDKGSDKKYDAPHWQDNSSPLDGDADDIGDRKYPVSFTRNSKMSISAKFIITPAATFSGEWKIRGTGSNNLSFPESNATIDGNELKIANVNCSTSFANLVDFINPITIFWEVSPDGGKTWCTAGGNRNRIYLTLEDPVASSTLYETLLDIGCRNAKGRNNATNAVASIWTDFSSPIPGVKRKASDGHNTVDGVEMKYWVNEGDPRLPIVGRICQSMQAMLDPFPIDQQLNGIGTCFAWATLFHEVLKSQGIDGSQIFEVIPNYLSPIPLDAAINTGLMLVKKWNFTTSGNAKNECSPFSHLNSEISDQIGASGQGITNPPGAFYNHFIVKYDNRYYDPSYGNGAFGGASDTEAQNAWENASLDGFIVKCTTGDIVAKRNDPAKLEMTFSGK